MKKNGGYVSATYTLPIGTYTDSKSVELIYVLDCSGSMLGAPIQQAKRALQGSTCQC